MRTKAICWPSLPKPLLKRARIVRKAKTAKPTKVRVPRAPSALEETLALQLRAAGITDYVREYKFCPDRRWRADFALVSRRILLECEGGIYSNGGHVRGKGYEANLEKYNTAALLGWTVLRYSASMIKEGRPIADLEYEGVTMEANL